MRVRRAADMQSSRRGSCIYITIAGGVEDSAQRAGGRLTAVASSTKHIDTVPYGSLWIQPYHRSETPPLRERIQKCCIFLFATSSSKASSTGTRRSELVARVQGRRRLCSVARHSCILLLVMCSRARQCSRACVPHKFGDTRTQFWREIVASSVIFISFIL